VAAGGVGEAGVGLGHRTKDSAGAGTARAHEDTDREQRPPRGDTSDLSRHGREVLRQRFKRVLSLPEPIWPVPSWALPDGAITGMAVPGAVPTDGEGQLGWGGDGAGWQLVVAPGGLVPDPDFGALVPEPVVCAIAGPASSASTPAIAGGVNHRCLMVLVLEGVGRAAGHVRMAPPRPFDGLN
jgi:hypothetical protein